MTDNNSAPTSGGAVVVFGILSGVFAITTAISGFFWWKERSKNVATNTAATTGATGATTPTGGTPPPSGTPNTGTPQANTGQTQTRT